MRVLPVNSMTGNLSKRIGATRATTLLGHTGFQLSSNHANNAFALHSTAGEYAASFAAGPRFLRSSYSDGSQLVLETNMPVTPHWYQLSDGIRFRFKRVKKTGSLGLLALDKAGGRVMIHIEKDGVLHYSAPKGKGVAAKLPYGRLPRNRTEALNAFQSMIDNKSIWAHDDDFRGASGDYPAGTGWSMIPGRGGNTAQRISGAARRPHDDLLDECSFSCGSGSWSGGGGSYSDPSGSASASASFSFSDSGQKVTVDDKKDKSHTLACFGATLGLVAALIAAVAGGTLLIGAGCGVAGAWTLGAACYGAIIASGALNVALVGTAVVFADACL